MLDEAGIASFIRNEHTAQLINVLIAPCQPSLCVVNDDDYDAAMELLRPHHDQTPASIAEWSCAGCGESNPPSSKSAGTARSRASRSRTPF